MSAIFESVKILFSEEAAVVSLARHLGTEVDETTRAVETATPGLIKAMADRSTAADGPGVIRSIIDLDDGSVIADIASFVAANKPALGAGMLDQVLGPAQADLAADIAAVAEIDLPTVRRMLPMLMPVVVGLVSKHRLDNRLGDTAVCAFLRSERDRLAAGAILVEDVEPVEAPKSRRFGADKLVIVGWAAAGLALVVGLAWALSMLASLGETAQPENTPADEAPTQVDGDDDGRQLGSEVDATDGGLDGDDATSTTAPTAGPDPAAQLAEVQAALAEAGLPDVVAEIQGDQVMLTGSVPTDQDKADAALAVLGIPGLRSIINQIEVVG